MYVNELDIDNCFDLIYNDQAVGKEGTCSQVVFNGSQICKAILPSSSCRPSS